MTTTRRRFLTTGAAFAVGPNILRAAETPASERVTLGFIGLGRMGRSHIVNNFCKRSNVHGLAVCDVDTTRRDWSKRELDKLNAKVHGAKSSPGVTAHNDYRELLERDDIDAVVISTPDHWHAKVALEALQAGKDLYLEKPLTHTLEESLILMKAVEASDRILQTGSMQRSYMPEFRVACELVVNGVIGEVMHADTNMSGPPTVCDLPEEEMEPGLDWDRWIGPAGVRPYHSDLCPRGVKDVSPAWRRYWDFGGGGVMDFGPHNVDIARWGMELDDTMPVEVRLDAKKSRDRGATLHFANGKTITHRREGAATTFHGTEGMIRVGRRLFELWRSKDKKDREYISSSQVPKAHDKYLAGSDVKQLYRCTDHHGDFIDAVRERGKVICPVGVGARTAMSCHLMNIAYRYGTDLKWDLEANALAEGSGDPAWLGRVSYRKGYELPS
ncbi:MAG: Gfo/Idh/MocA family oxidoreductase [Verrucomicrobiota bacterium]